MALIIKTDMKKTLSILLLSIFTVVVPATAQDDAGRQLRAMAAAVKALGDYSVSFKLTAEGNTLVGEYTVSRDRYSLNVGDAEVYSDGRTRYEINHSDDEILIDILDPEARDILSNPTRAFDFADDEFTSTYGGTTTVSGKAYHVVHLVPRDRDSSIRNVELLIDRTTNLPFSISYAADGLGGYVVVELLRIGAAGALPDSLFSPDLTLFRGYEVIDFR